MRWIVLVFALCSNALAQDIEVLSGHGAVIHVADLEREATEAKAESERLRSRLGLFERLVPEYIPTYTWPGHNGPKPFEALRQHLNGEIIHPKQDVSDWTPAELAFKHDMEHLDEVLAQGKALPLIKDQRLRDWLRSKAPAMAPRKGKWKISKLVMHTQESCPPCKQWLRENKAAVEADGLTLDTAGPDYRGTPAFDVTFCDGQACKTLQVGYMSYQTMKGLMR